MKENIEKLFKNQKIEINSQKSDVFSLFFDILLQNNEKVNLTRIVEKEEVAKKHFLDSVISEKFIPKNAKVIDVGAGAGFPSIPLKIIREDLTLTLIDSVAKKVNFLKTAIQELNLKQIDAIHSRSEELAHKIEFRESFDVCVSRAVAQLNTLCEYCLPFVKVGGIFIAYKTVNSEEELINSTKAIEMLGGSLQEIYPYNLDSERQHCLVIIKKIRRTLNNYPRRGNKPRLTPIL